MRFSSFISKIFQFSKGNRQQLLIADSRTISAFVASGTKFPQCSTFTDRTCEVQCKVRSSVLIIINDISNDQVVDGLTSISLSGSRVKTVSQSRIYTGNNCEWIDMNKVKDNSDCDNGDKFVIKNKRGTNRRQLLNVDGKTI